MASRVIAWGSLLTVMLAAHLCAVCRGEDKPRPRWELKDKPSVWESTWRNCGDDDDDGGSGAGAGAGKGLFTVQDVIPSPGSFAGRTGHSGSTKFVVETNGRRVDEASRHNVQSSAHTSINRHCSFLPRSRTDIKNK